MQPIFLIEAKKYDESELNKVLKLDKDEYYDLELELLRRKIIEVKNDRYIFNYVGIIVFNQRLLIVLPKYVKKETDKIQRIDLVKTLIKVLKVYARESVEEDKLEFLHDVIDSADFSYLLALDFFISDYIQNGLYQKEKNEYIINGQGETEWGRTIDEIQAFIVNKAPVYFDVYSREIYNDEEYYMKNLHKHILNLCSSYLEETGLIHFMEYPVIKFEIDENSLGDDEFKLSSIESEMQQEFTDRKLMLLKAMHNFFKRQNSPESSMEMSFYGTRSFHNVWEKACAFALGHEKDILNEIARPSWTDFHITDNKRDTLIPDIIRSLRQGYEKIFFIFDAKYYDILFYGSRVYNNPGIDDIIKQYMYEKALTKYIVEENHTSIYNVLLFPSESLNIRKLGKVSLEFLSTLQDINLIQLPAKKVFELYAARKIFSKTDWEKLIGELKDNKILDNIKF